MADYNSYKQRSITIKTFSFFQSSRLINKTPIVIVIWSLFVKKIMENQDNHIAQLLCVNNYHINYIRIKPPGINVYCLIAVLFLTVFFFKNAIAIEEAMNVTDDQVPTTELAPAPALTIELETKAQAQSKIEPESNIELKLEPEPKVDLEPKAELESKEELELKKEPELKIGPELKPEPDQPEFRIKVNDFSVAGISENLHPKINQQEIEQFLNKARLKNPQGFTLEELSRLAKSITHIFRQAGFILTQVILPEQDINQGVIVFQVLEGYLEAVVVNGDTSYEQSVLTAPFNQLIELPLNNQSLEEAMLQLNDLPGLTLAGILRPGGNPGTTELVLDIKEEKKIDASLLFDNYGTEFTGKHRAWFGFNYNNPSGVGDKLGINIVRTEGPDSTVYGSLSYQYPFYIPKSALKEDYLVGAEYSRNSFQLGQQLEELKIKGISDTVNIFLQKSLMRARSESIFARIGFARKNSSTEQLSYNIAKDTLSVLSLKVSSDNLLLTEAMSYQFSLGLHQGISGLFGAMSEKGSEDSSRVGGSGAFASGTFNKMSFNYTQFYAVNPNNSFIMRINGQISKDLLISMEQMPLGGPNSVRAYPTSEYLFDTAAFLTTEWKINLNSFYSDQYPSLNQQKEKLELALFLDLAAGYLNDPLVNEVKSTNIKGYGVGLLLQNKHKNLLTSRVDIARPIGSIRASNDQSFQIHFNMAYQF